LIQRVVFVAALTALVGCQPAGDVGESSAELVVTDQCEISGLGVLAGGDLGVGRITGGDTGASGDWVHLSVTEGVVLASPEYVLCRINGSILGDFGGSATVNGETGFTYRVSVQDRGTPGDRTIIEGTPTVETVTASRFYRPTRYTDGSLAITADQARVTIPSELTVVSGSSGRGRADVVFTRADTLDRVRCHYRGNGRHHRGGDRYRLRHCHGLRGLPRVRAGDTVDVTSLHVHVQSGDHGHGRSRHADTTVTVNFDVTPLTVVEPERDFYRMAVFDSAGDSALLAEGPLVHGNFVVEPLD